MASRTSVLVVLVSLILVGAPVVNARAGPSFDGISAKWTEFKLSYVTPSMEWAKNKLTSFNPMDTEGDESSHENFLQWKATHSAVYAEDSDEHTTRFNVFKENARLIQEHNAEGHSYKLAINKFADLTNEEFKTKMTPRELSHTSNANGAFRYENTVLPPDNHKNGVDWRKEDAVTPVKNQGQCGDCWSFSTTGSVEGINAIVRGKLKPLSEQELVDCDTKFDHGCGGGLMDYAFDYILNNGGIDSEKDYPYVSIDGHKEECKNKKVTRDVALIDGFEDVPANNEKALMKAAKHQPVSVAIEADTFPFQFYSSGVLTSPGCGTRLDHAVLVVGYGVEEESDTKYWIVKNSWGGTWGEEGYLRILRNVEESGPGICGIAMAASYPTLAKDPNTATVDPKAVLALEY